MALNNASPVDRPAINQLRDDVEVKAAANDVKAIGKPPTIVQAINKWLGLPKMSKTLADILDIADNAKLANKNKQLINKLSSEVDDNADDIDDNEDSIKDNTNSMKANKRPMNVSQGQ